MGTTRRDALAGTAAGFFILKPGTAFGSQANSAIHVGIIGTGNRGSYDTELLSKDPRARIAALCDVNPAHIDRVKTTVPAAEKAKVFKSHEELLADPGIDAVLIATPVYLHPEHFEAAVKAKKHIYCEKPAGADVAGVKRLLKASQSADKTKHIQFGFQQRHSPEYLAAEKILNSPEFGQLLYMQSYWLVGGMGFAKPAAPVTEEQKKQRWYPWRTYSGDIIVEQHCHGVDVLNWYAKAHPVKAIGAGGRMKPAESGDVLDHLDVTYDYPSKVKGHLTGVQLPPGAFSEVKEMFWGSESHIVVARRYYEHRLPKKNPIRVESKREITIDAFENFFNRIANGQPQNEATFAAESTLTSMLGRMAIYEKREVTWDEMMRSA
jgi:predicted dehydrogenase